MDELPWSCTFHRTATMPNGFAESSKRKQKLEAREIADVSPLLTTFEALPGFRASYFRRVPRAFSVAEEVR